MDYALVPGDKGQGKGKGKQPGGNSKDELEQGQSQSQSLWQRFQCKCREKWSERDYKGLLTLFKPGFSLFLHFFDWGFDLALLRQLVLSKDYWWASICAGFIIMGGVGSAIMAWAPVYLLLPYVLGFGPVAELMISPQILAGDYSSRWVLVKAAEPLLEAVPSVGFQIYLIIFKGLESMTFVQWASLAGSLASAGYGMMAMLQDLPVFGGNIQPVARSRMGSAIMLLVPLDLLLYMVPISLFMREAAFRPWSITVVPLALWLFEMMLTTFFEYKDGHCFGYWGGGLILTLPFIAFAECYTIAARVMVLWVHDNDASFRTRPVWISHGVQVLVRLGMAWLVVPPWAQPWLWGGLGIVAVVTNILLWAMIQAKGTKHQRVRSEADCTQPMPAMTCLCW